MLPSREVVYFFSADLAGPPTTLPDKSNCAPWLGHLETPFTKAPIDEFAWVHLRENASTSVSEFRYKRNPLGSAAFDVVIADPPTLCKDCKSDEEISS